MLRPQLRLPDADSALDSSLEFALWQVALLHCCCVVILAFHALGACCSHAFCCPLSGIFFELSPVFSCSPPLAARCLSHTQKVVKMQIKLETNWAGRQHTHTQCSFSRGVHVCVCVLLLCGPSMGWGFLPFCCLLSAGLAACK